MSKANAGKLSVTKPTSNKLTKSGKKSRPAAGELSGTTTAAEGQATRMVALNGVSACKLLKYMGANGYSRKQAGAIALHLWPTISGSTIGCQLYSGRAGANGNTPTHPGKPADLDAAQAAELVALCQKLTNSAPTPPAKADKKGK